MYEISNVSKEKKIIIFIFILEHLRHTAKRQFLIEQLFDGKPFISHNYYFVVYSLSLGLVRISSINEGMSLGLLHEETESNTTFCLKVLCAFQILLRVFRCFIKT